MALKSGAMAEPILFNFLHEVLRFLFLAILYQSIGHKYDALKLDI